MENVGQWLNKKGQKDLTKIKNLLRLKT